MQLNRRQLRDRSPGFRVRACSGPWGSYSLSRQLTDHSACFNSLYLCESSAKLRRHTTVGRSRNCCLHTPQPGRRALHSVKMTIVLLRESPQVRVPISKLRTLLHIRRHMLATQLPPPPPQVQFPHRKTGKHRSTSGNLLATPGLPTPKTAPERARRARVGSWLRLAWR